MNSRRIAAVLIATAFLLNPSFILPTTGDTASAIVCSRGCLTAGVA